MQGKSIAITLITILLLSFGAVQFWRNGIMPEVRRNHPEWLKRDADFSATDAVAMAGQAELECQGMTVTTNRQLSVNWVVGFDGQIVTVSKADDQSNVFQADVFGGRLFIQRMFIVSRSQSLP